MKNYLFLTVMGIAVVIGNVAWAGEMRSEHYKFEIQWPDTYSRISKAENQALILVLSDEKNDWGLALVVGSGDSKGEEYLRSEATVPVEYKNSAVKKKYKDAMVTFCGVPAREFVFQSNQQTITGFFHTVANQTHYILTGAGLNKTPAAFQKWFAKRIASFRINPPGSSIAQVKPGLKTDESGKKNPVTKIDDASKKRPDANGDFGSDF